MLAEYDAVKEAIDYPSIRDLSVEITGEDLSINCEKVFPAESDNVYVLDWNDHVLNFDGTKTPVEVKIKVW